MTALSGESAAPSAIVLGTGLTALGVLRCLARAGIPSVCASSEPDFESRSRWYRAASHRVSAWATLDELRAALEASGIRSGVLIPCSDHWAIEVARLGDGKALAACSAPADVVATLVDKDGFRAELDRAGVAHPFTRPVADEDELAALMASAPDGVFLKPTDSQRFVSTFSCKAFTVSRVDDAVARFREARDAGISLVLQEYIAGGAEGHVFVDGFVTREHHIHAVLARRRLRMHPADFGNSSAMVTIDAREVSEATDALGRLFDTTGYRGIFSAEFLHDGRDGGYKLLEVNCRPWWYVEFAARCGVNVIEMACRDAMGEALPRPGEVAVGAEMVYGYYDFHACRRLVREGKMRWWDCACSWMRSSKAIFTPSDPAPALWNLSRRIRRRAAAGGG